MAKEKRAGPDPTLSGYLEFCRKIDHGSYEERTGAEREATKAWMDHWFQPKPAIVDYQYLQQAEDNLLDRSRGADGKKGKDMLDRAAQQVARVHHPGDYGAARSYVGDRHRDWVNWNKWINDMQKSSYEELIKEETAEREKLKNGESRDTTEFFARREVVSSCLQQHENAEEVFDQDVTNYVGELLDRRARNVGVVKGEIQREAREVWGDPDKAQEAWDKFQDRQKGADQDKERER